MRSNIFKSNPDGSNFGFSNFRTGSFQYIATMIEKEWWGVQRNKIDKLSKEIGFEIIELLPSEYQNKLLGSPEIYDEENPPDDSFLLKTYPPSKSGNDYEVVCFNDVFKASKKVTKKEKDEVLDILHGLSQEPSGSALPRPQNVKTVGNSTDHLRRKFKLNKEAGEGKIVFYQYKCGRSGQKRCLWTKRQDKVVILYYGSREGTNKLWNS